MPSFIYWQMTIHHNYNVTKNKSENIFKLKILFYTLIVNGPKEL
jgi:hypothetical protein